MSLQACANIVAEGDPARFRAVMTFPVAMRARLLPILAFNLEVSRAPYVTAEPMIARIRLQWWRDCLGEIFGGGDVRRHEVSTPLSEVIRDLGLERSLFEDMINARETDIDGFVFSEWNALWDYLDASGGALFAALAHIMGVEGNVRELGKGVAAAGWLRAVPDLTKRGGQILPDADASEFVQWGLIYLQEAPKVKPLNRFGYLSHLVLQKALSDPKAIIEGRLEPSPIRAQMAFLRALI